MHRPGGSRNPDLNAFASCSLPDCPHSVIPTQTTELNSLWSGRRQPLQTAQCATASSPQLLTSHKSLQPVRTQSFTGCPTPTVSHPSASSRLHSLPPKLKAPQSVSLHLSPQTSIVRPHLRASQPICLHSEPRACMSHLRSPQLPTSLQGCISRSLHRLPSKSISHWPWSILSMEASSNSAQFLFYVESSSGFPHYGLDPFAQNTAPPSL